MSKVFRPQAPAPLPPPPPPSPVSEDPATKAATQKAMEDAAAAERKTKGRAATMLTGGAGLQDEANIARRTLLGV